MDHITLANLAPLMERTAGHAGIKIALISGSLALAPVAGIFSRICPDCTLLPQPVAEKNPEQVADAILASLAAEADVINLSESLPSSFSSGAGQLREALNYAARDGVLVVAPAGTASLAGHPWVIPVAACNSNGLPLRESNIARPLGGQGILAPGLDGASACPFVTATLALLRAEFSMVTARELKQALLVAAQLARPRAIVPPLLNAAGAWQLLDGALNRQVA
jgi:subtilisin family serine protease